MFWEERLLTCSGDSIERIVLMHNIQVTGQLGEPVEFIKDRPDPTLGSCIEKDRPHENGFPASRCVGVMCEAHDGSGVWSLWEPLTDRTVKASLVHQVVEWPQQHSARTGSVPQALETRWSEHLISARQAAEATMASEPKDSGVPLLGIASPLY